MKILNKNNEVIVKGKTIKTPDFGKTTMAKQFMYILVISQVSFILLLMLIGYTQNNLSDWLYKTYTAPFLAQTLHIQNQR